MRRLRDLVSVGVATVADLDRLGIHSVEELARHEPQELYQRLCDLDGMRLDPCVLDVFQAAVAQARDPDLPDELKRWWTWSRIRKEQASAMKR